MTKPASLSYRLGYLRTHRTIQGETIMHLAALPLSYAGGWKLAVRPAPANDNTPNSTVPKTA